MYRLGESTATAQKPLPRTAACLAPILTHSGFANGHQIVIGANRMIPIALCSPGIVAGPASILHGRARVAVVPTTKDPARRVVNAYATHVFSNVFDFGLLNTTNVLLWATCSCTI